MSKTEDKVFICRCEEVTKEEIEQAIKDGATSLRAVKLATHAGMGLCQGRYCQKLISGMLSTVKNAADITPYTSRPPVRIAKISEFVVEEDEE
jgi:NAD(P)H-nitrite reductase large subunit